MVKLVHRRPGHLHAILSVQGHRILTHRLGYLPELLEGIVRNRMRFSLLSNGALIDDEIAAFIASTRRCEYVQVSVDGSCAKTHDSCRGKGSFDGAIRGIRTLQRHQVNVAVRVTIHQKNVNDLENIAHLLLEELSGHLTPKNKILLLGFLDTAPPSSSLSTLLEYGTSVGKYFDPRNDVQTRARGTALRSLGHVASIDVGEDPGAAPAARTYRG